MRVTAIVPAAGIGTRMKRGPKKPFLILGNKPILAHTLSKLQKSRYIKEIILVVNKKNIDSAERLVKDFALGKVTKITEGGKTRFESVRKGLAAIDKKTDLVLIHDGMRPFVDSSILRKTVKQALAFGAAVAAIPASSTVKFVGRNKIIDFTADRDRLWIINTPQVFKSRLILKAYKNAEGNSKRFFDDSMLAEKSGAKVKIVSDSYYNIKITTPLDLVIGEAILKNSKFKV